MHITVDADVVIVGFGPGGEVLASLLGQAGHRVVVFERFPAPYGLPRMSTLDGEICRIMQHTCDPVKALAGMIPQLDLTIYGADGEVALTVDWSAEICGHPSHLTLHQPDIEAAMEERIYSCPSVDVRWGAEVVNVEELGDSVRVTARRSSGSEGPAEDEERVIARYVVGMDGASSFVRQSLGIELDVLHMHTDRWVLTDFDILDPAMPEPPTAIHADPAGPYYWGPNGAGRCRTDVKVMDDEVTDDELRDPEKGYDFLERVLGISRDKVHQTRRVVYRFRSQYACTFRKGNLFIGGDAAHAMTPGMSQGSCSAMRDGLNLAWKLDLVLTGRARPELLDSYEPERMTHVIPLVQGSLQAWKLAAATDPEEAAARDAFLRSGQVSFPPIPGLTTGVVHRGPDGEIAEPAGMLGPQGRVRIGDREGLIDDLVGFGFQLITTLPLDDLLNPEQRRRLESIGAKLLQLGSGHDLAEDVDGTYTEFLSRYGAMTLLARPDFYLFGIADGAEQTSALVDELSGALSLTPSSPAKARWTSVIG